MEKIYFSCADPAQNTVIPDPQDPDSYDPLFISYVCEKEGLRHLDVADDGYNRMALTDHYIFYCLEQCKIKPEGLQLMESNEDSDDEDDAPGYTPLPGGDVTKDPA